MEISRSRFKIVKKKKYVNSINILIKQRGRCSLGEKYTGGPDIEDEIKCSECPFSLNNITREELNCYSLEPEELYQLAKRFKEKFLDSILEEIYVY